MYTLKGNLIFCVFFKILKKVFKGPIANDGPVSPDRLAALNVFVKDVKECPVCFTRFPGRICNCIFQISFRDRNILPQGIINIHFGEWEKIPRI